MIKFCVGSVIKCFVLVGDSHGEQSFCKVFIYQTLPKAQRTRGLSFVYQNSTSSKQIFIKFHL